MKLSDEEKEEYNEPNYCSEIITSNVTKKKGILSFFKSMLDKIVSIGTSSYDSKYNAMDDGIVTSIKNQGSLGTCWAFSAISAIETNALKNGLPSYDFSEAHMIYSLESGGYSDEEGKKGKYLTENLNGGKITYAPSYYFNSYGQLLEEEMPYDSNKEKITINEYVRGRKIISIDTYEWDNVSNYAACTDGEIDNIKSKILASGSVQGIMYMDEDLLTGNYNDYYISTTENSSLVNHGITIIGWDDEIPKENFTGATRDGAWIIKNSWGKNWSQDGLFYISYDDNFICKNVVNFSGVSNNTYDNTYNAADLVGIPTFILDETDYISARFTKQTEENELLKKVSYAVGKDMNYTVYLSKDNELTNSANWIVLDSGISSTYGIKSVSVDNNIIEDDFTIIIKYDTTSNASSVFTMCDITEDTSNLEYSTNTNYISDDGVNWYDMSTISTNNGSIACEPNIYAYTNTLKEPFIEINNLTINDNEIIAYLKMKNIDNSKLIYKVLNDSDEDVSNLFTITPNYDEGYVKLLSDSQTFGKFKLVILYDELSLTKDFELKDNTNEDEETNEDFEIIDKEFMELKSNYIKVSISNNYTFNYLALTNNIDPKNNEIVVYDNEDILVDNTSIIGTNYKIKIGLNTYNIVVLGDINSDAKISALDYIEVRKHIMGNIITDTFKLLAADLDENTYINALDYIAIRKILMR